MTEDFWIGSLYFSEPFGDDLISRLNLLPPITTLKGQTYKLKAEHVSIHEVSIDYQTKYRLIIDRFSYLYPQAIGLFMGFAFQGVHIVNNPFSFYYYLRNKDAAYIIARELGISIPKTYILPPKLAPALKPEDFKYHKFFDWYGMTQDLGWPIVIKPAEGREAIGVDIAHSMEELMHYYDQSGSQVMMVQAKVKTPHPWQIRALCIGRSITPIKYIFRKGDASEYLFDPQFLTPEIGQRVIDICRVINRLLGYEMNSVEMFLDDRGDLQAIDFNNPVPDGRIKALGSIFYNDYQQAMVELVTDIVREQRPYTFLPTDVNEMADIARRRDLNKIEKFRAALSVANRYYERG